MRSWIVMPLLSWIVMVGCDRQAAPLTNDRPVEHVTQKPIVAESAADSATEPAAETVALGSPGLLAGIPGEGSLTVAELRTWLDDPTNHAALEVEFPMWLQPGCGQAKGLKDNPMTRAKIELGRQLFFDPRLSADNSISCASCHEPGKGFTIETPVATGINGQLGKRNPPTLLNRAMLSLGHDKQFWDGRSYSVEDALLHALSDPAEMAASVDATVKKLNTVEGYRLQFDAIYGEVTWSTVGDALGCFVRNLVTGSSPYDYYARWQGYAHVDQDELQEWLKDDPAFADRYRQDKANAESHPLSASAVRGEYLFFGNKAWCSACHNGVNFTDELYHNIGIGMGADTPDLGRYNVTQNPEDWGAFKTPTIRGAIFTAPYMHDGSLATLEEVVEWYAHEGLENRNLDYRFRRIEELTEQDKNDLVEFVKACSGPLSQVESGRLPE